MNKKFVTKESLIFFGVFISVFVFLNEILIFVLRFFVN